MTIPNTPALSGLRCALPCLVEAIAKAVALRNGCTEDEADTIRCTQSRALTPSFAALRAGDGRELRRFATISELDDLLRDPLEAAFFGKAVRRACAAAT